MAKSVQLKWAIWIYMLLNWTAVAYASESPFVAGIEKIPAKAVVYVFGLAVLGGAAGTLTKLARTDIVVRNLSLEITKDIVASLAAGVFVFLFTSWWDDINFWLQAAFITLAGYGGSKVLDLALADGLLPWMQRVFGRNVDAAPNRPPVDHQGGAQ